MKIENQKVVSFHYTLKDADGKILDTSVNGEPLEYLHGAHNIIPGLECELEGLTAGTKKHVEVEPEQGYGVRRDDLIAEMPRSAIDFEGEIVAGMQFHAQTPDGQIIPLTVVSVSDDKVKLDGNHPMAGVKLFFDVEIIGIRDASAHELREGRPHQKGCTCGCHGNDSDHKWRQRPRRQDGDCCHGNDDGHDCCGGHGNGDHECCHGNGECGCHCDE